MADQSAQQFDKETFAGAIARDDVPVLVDFWAPWCGPCVAIGPTIESLASKFAGRAVVGKVNVDDHPELAATYSVSSIPTILVFRGGEPVARFVGIRSEDELAAALDEAVAATA